MNAEAVIRRKRDGGELSSAAIAEFVNGFVAGAVPDYQMSALLMAVMWRGMTSRETADLTRAMLAGGDRLSFPGIPGPKVDKHSTGGVGDFVSLPLAPMVAACGVHVPMVAGRGLGHTGGTLDKLESIPGFRTDLGADEFARVLERVGYAMGGQTATLAPADRRMYALRDVTATVESIPLIVSSILSKKAAAGIDALVLDVKCGRGAFMKTDDTALALAGELVRVGRLLDLPAAAFVTDMDVPLGRAVGNALEVDSALDCLSGRGPGDVMELVFTLGTAMLCLGRRGSDWESNRARLERAASDGSARDRFRYLIAEQGGDAHVVDDPGRLPRSAAVVDVPAETAGYVTDIEPVALGRAVVELGGGRLRADDVIDPGVGIALARKPGDRVLRGEPWARVHARHRDEADRVIREFIAGAVTVGADPPAMKPLIRYLVTEHGARAWAGPETWTEGAGIAAPLGSPRAGVESS